MRLGQKIRYLREMEGALRGLDREMTQQEVVHAIRKELRQSISQAYLSQIESGARPHLTSGTRELLARFFKVHPGYLVSDPPGFSTELTTNLRVSEGPLDAWLRAGAATFEGDTDLQNALQRLADHDDTRKCLILLGAIVDTPGLVDRLFDALKPVNS